VVQRAREAGLKPAGEDGTYQFFNLKRSRMATGSIASVNGKELIFERDLAN
jgi:hypothetical protein